MKNSFNNHPINKHRWSHAQRIADKLANFAGSWGFIFFVIVFTIIWAMTNAYEIIEKFDPYPFAFLNLMLAIITAVMAPIILMSQNRESQRDRIRAEYDYQINKKSEKEIQEIKKQLDRIERKLR
jgi:uncharacterized membrane protein